jgi:hypothetical protein
MLKKYKDGLKEVAKELGRWLVAAVLPASIAYFSELDAQWALYLTLLLRLADRVVHLYGKKIKDERLVKGLVRF